MEEASWAPPAYPARRVGGRTPHAPAAVSSTPASQAIPLRTPMEDNTRDVRMKKRKKSDKEESERWEREG
jgi:hypothetical protein